MKIIILGVVTIMGLTAANANCTEIHMEMTEVNGNTMITCVPDREGDIERAYLSLYAADGQELYVSRREMEVSYENVATYELTGAHDAIEGRCKVIFSEGDNSIAREEFSITMK